MQHLAHDLRRKGATHRATHRLSLTSGTAESHGKGLFSVYGGRVFPCPLIRDDFTPRATLDAPDGGAVWKAHGATPVIVAGGF